MPKLKIRKPTLEANSQLQELSNISIVKNVWFLLSLVTFGSSNSNSNIYTEVATFITFAILDY